MINASMSEPSTDVSELGVTGLRHCLYKCRATQQLWAPAQLADQVRLDRLYQSLYSGLHRKGVGLKLVHQQLATETMLGWVSDLSLLLEEQVISSLLSILDNIR